MATRFSGLFKSFRRFVSGGNRTVVRPTANALCRGSHRLEDRTVPALFSGGMAIAMGDVNGDGIADVITGAGPGAAPQVVVTSGKTGQVLKAFNAFDSGFTGGVFVAAGDVNGDKRADIIVGAGRGGTPHVKVFDFNSGITIHDFLAYNKRFSGGVRVASADIDADGKADIVTAAGPGGGPHVQMFSGVNGKILQSFFAFDAKFTNGVYVAGGDITGDGRDDVVVGAGEGGAPLVSVFEPARSAQVNRTFFAYDPTFRGGVHVGVGDVTNARGLDIITGPGAGGGPHVQVFNSDTGKAARSFYAYDANFTGGVFIASRVDLNGFGANDILTAPGAGGGPHIKGFDGDNLGTLVSYFGYSTADTPLGSGTQIALPADTVAPTVTITSPTNSPTQRTNLTVTGKAVDDRVGLQSVQVQVDGGAFQNVATDAAGNFTFTTTFPLNGSRDGSHTVGFRATDRNGNVSTVKSVSFTLDSSVTVPTADLSADTDTGTVGDLITSNATVSIVGKTDANATLVLTQTGASVTADASGNYRFNNVALGQGPNTITIRATDTLGNTAENTITITRNSGPTVIAGIADVNVAMNASPTVIDLSTNFDDVDIVNSIVRFNTSLGPIEVELTDKATPLTVANFINYVTSGRYNESIFHRLVNNFVLQGGGFTFESNPSRLDAVPTDAPVQNEPGQSNVRGTIAMAKLDGQPNSATSQWFFNLVDNSGNLDVANGGFTVFGKVVTGLDIIDQFAQFQIRNQGGVFSEIPMTDYTGTNFPTDTKFGNYAGINNISIVRRSDRLTYTVVSNSNSGLVTPTISGNKLTLNYATGQTGTATITIRATDLDGSFIEDTFTVNVT